jgi:PKD repeat protein
VVVNPKTDVNIINLATGYSVEADPVKLEADVPGGVFTGPGVFPTTGYFDPAIADTINSPHTIYYTYENTNGCESVDSAQVFVLGANGVLYIPDDLVCQDAEPFEATASNVAGVIGSFTLFDSNEQSVPGLTDNGDNTASVDPSVLTPGAYIIEYEYFDMVNLYLRTPFLMEVVDAPLITAPEQEIYCQNDPVVDLVSNVTSAIFSGAGVTQNGIDGYAFDPRQADPGNHVITCTVTSQNGCSNFAEKEVTVLFAPEVKFTVGEACMPLEGGTITFTNQTTNKAQVESWEWDFGDPDSGEDNQSNLADPTHFYQEPGQRVIQLAASTADGCVASHTLDTVFGVTPEANFTLMSNCYQSGSEIYFMNRTISTEVPDTLIWNFRNSTGTLLDQVGSNPQDTVGYAFGSAADYQVDLYVLNPGGCADTVSSVISLKPTVQLVDGRYEEDFDSSEGLWTIHSENQVESWTWSEPDFTGFTPDPGDKAWFTLLPVNTIDYLENSWIESPCLDLSALNRPFIRMDLMRSFVPMADGAVLQYMDSYEKGWKNVGEIESGLNWYNLDNITRQPGGNGTGWGLTLFNPDTDWVTASHDLGQAAGKRAVSLRVAVATGGRQAIGNQGFAFDNITIAERSRRSVLEYFTNSSEPNAVSVDDYVDAIAAAQYANVIDLQYHVDYPGFDPMNANNPEPAADRVFNYGIPSIPYAILDGGLGADHRYGFVDENEDLEKDLLAQTLQTAPFDVDLTVEWLEGSLVATTKVTCNVDHYDGNIQLRIVVFESSVDAYTGGNGDTHFRNVVLDMLPATLLGNSWTRGKEDTRTDTWTYASYIEDLDDLGVAAFIVDRNDGHVLHANVKYADSSVPTSVERPALTTLQIYPNPAREVMYVNLGRTIEQEGHIKLVDMSGRVVLHQQLPSGYQIFKLDVDHLDRGVYVVQWEQAGVIQGLEKLIKTE